MIFAFPHLGGGLILSSIAFYRSMRKGQDFAPPLAGLALSIVSISHLFFWPHLI